MNVTKIDVINFVIFNDDSSHLCRFAYQLHSVKKNSIVDLFNINFSEAILNLPNYDSDTLNFSCGFSLMYQKMASVIRTLSY